MKTLGQRIRELREKKDLSLREFAKRIGVSAPFVSDIELGRRYPSDKLFEIMANELDVSTEDLRVYDTRPPVEGLKRLTAINPQYAFAFRKVIDKNISPDDIIKFAEKKSKGKKNT
ncbi:MAG: helix-turn-helix transcriptional regulator [Thermodesulfobacteriota bacterium]|jgi:transcriptional regulator with XRE-family HTH domain|nr:MAG: helix-turn-helix transcriptional regulator [Thermodesulfobacteriota bacterium]